MTNTYSEAETGGKLSEIDKILRVISQILELSAEAQASVVEFLHVRLKVDPATPTQPPKAGLGRPKKTKRSNPNSGTELGRITEMAIKVVHGAGEPVGAAEVLRLIRKQNPVIKPASVYQALHYAAGLERIGKSMATKSSKAFYFKLPGGNNKQDALTCIAPVLFPSL